MYRAGLGFLCFCFFSHECFAVPTTTTFPVATTDPRALITVPKSRYERGLEDYDESFKIQNPGMAEIHYDDHEENGKEQKAIQGDPWAGYYDFLINEGSFKFWAVFQLVTALILVYASFAAVYYAKFNVIAPDYSDDYDLLGRSYQKPSASSLWSGLSVQNFQRILDAVSSKKYN